MWTPQNCHFTIRYAQILLTHGLVLVRHVDLTHLICWLCIDICPPLICGSQITFTESYSSSHPFLLLDLQYFHTLEFHANLKRAQTIKIITDLMAFIYVTWIPLSFWYRPLNKHGLYVYHVRLISTVNYLYGWMDKINSPHNFFQRQVNLDTKIFTRKLIGHRSGLVQQMRLST